MTQVIGGDHHVPMNVTPQPGTPTADLIYLGEVERVVDVLTRHGAKPELRRFDLFVERVGTGCANRFWIRAIGESAFYALFDRDSPGDTVTIERPISFEEDRIERIKRRLPPRHVDPKPEPKDDPSPVPIWQYRG